MWLLSPETLSLHIRGAIHVGANECEDIEEYFKLQCSNILWIEARKTAVQRARLKYPDAVVIHAVIGNVDGHYVDFMEMNTPEFSTFHPLKTHKLHYPLVWEHGRYRVSTVRLASVLTTHKLENYNFLKIDVQGSEMEVLESLGACLADIEFVYVRVYSQQLFLHTPTTEDVDKFLHPTHRRIKIRMTMQGWGEALYQARSSSSLVAPDPPISTPNVDTPDDTPTLPKPLPIALLQNAERKAIIISAETHVSWILAHAWSQEECASTVLPGLVEAPETLVRNIHQFEQHMKLYSFQRSDHGLCTLWKADKTDRKQFATNLVPLFQILLPSLKTVVIDQATPADVIPNNSNIEYHLFSLKELPTASNLGLSTRSRCRRLKLASHRALVKKKGYELWLMSLDEYCRDNHLWAIDLLYLKDLITVENLLSIISGCGSLSHIRLFVCESPTRSASEEQWNSVWQCLQHHGFHFMCGVHADGRLSVIHSLPKSHDYPSTWLALKQPCLF